MGSRWQGEVATGEAALAAAQALRPDLILMDVHLPGIDGPEATRRILAGPPSPRSPVVVLLSTDDEGEECGWQAAARPAMSPNGRSRHDGSVRSGPRHGQLTWRGPLPGSIASTLALRIVFAEDNYLVREGTAALLAEADGLEVVAVVADLPQLLDAVADRSRRRADRYPDAANAYHRGDPGGPPDPGRPPGGRGGGAVAVCRGGVRLRAAGRRRDRAGLSAQGAYRPGGGAGPGAPGGGQGRFGAGPQGG